MTDEELLNKLNQIRALNQYPKINSQYQEIVKHSGTSIEKQCQTYQEKQYKYNPLISIIIPVFNIDPQWLDLCLQSIKDQCYKNWELFLFDDGSDNQDTVDFLKSWQNTDSRINIKICKSNLGAPIILNKMIGLAKGEYIAFLEHDDVLRKDALLQIVKYLNKDKSIEFIYSDEVKINQDGDLFDPNFKSDLNLDALLSFNYIGNFSLVKKTTGDKLNWFRKEYESAHNFDLYLRLISINAKTFHIPEILIHKRFYDASDNMVSGYPNYRDMMSKSAIKYHLVHNKIQADVKTGLFENSFRINRSYNDNHLVSIIIPFRDRLDLLKTCLDSLLSITRYQSYEILLINNQSQDNDVAIYCKSLCDNYKNIRLYDFDKKFNFAEMNNFAVTKAKGESILFLNNDVSKAVITIMNIIIVLTPLIGTIFGVMYYYNSKEFTELLLAQPIKRSQIFMGQYLGISISLTLSLVLGLGIPFVAYGLFKSAAIFDFGLLLVTGSFLNFIFVALAFNIAMSNENKIKGFGYAILMWLFLAVVYDGLFLMSLVVFTDYPLDKFSLFATMLNPIDLSRILILLKLDISALLGYTGAVFKQFFGTSFGLILSLLTLSIWVLLPVWRINRKLRKKDF